MGDQSLQSIYKKIIAGWLGLVLFGAAAVVGAISGEWGLLLAGGAMTAASVAVLIMVSRQMGRSMRDYVPGKGFWYYRMTPRNKIRYLTIGEIVVVAMVLIFFFAGELNTAMFTSAVVGLLYIELLMKRRIKYHTAIDDATLFELEELGVIGQEHVVNGMYKDFQSWDDAVEGSKIIVLTIDLLIVIRINQEDELDQLHIRLNEIRRVGVIANGRQGQGLVLALGLEDGTIIRFTLIGESFQDSPEQFVQQFLQTMDKLLASSPYGTSHTADASNYSAPANPEQSGEHSDNNGQDQTVPNRPSAPRQRVLDL
ncbi:MAG: hypothetical protein K0Q59_4360 [Paenibacillus sp.]|jgi:hypothetical protein|nr:hypothetical protein [Paenibacillus sp.]